MASNATTHLYEMDLTKGDLVQRLVLLHSTKVPIDGGKHYGKSNCHIHRYSAEVSSDDPRSSHGHCNQLISHWYCIIYIAYIGTGTVLNYLAYISTVSNHLSYIGTIINYLVYIGTALII